ncbi:MAG: MBL fold metallo-hydrolase [Patescibacteria group bacterium]
MIINYNGVESFKIQTGSFILAFNPVSKDSKFKTMRFGADTVCVSTNLPDFNGIDQNDAKNKELLVIDGPGEYETAGVFIKGFATKTEYGGKSLINTIYSVLLEGMTIGFLGALGEIINGEIIECLGDVDILFVPIGGEGVLSASDANKLAVKLGAKIIIPMHYGEVGEKDALKKFLKESGSEDIKAVEKLTIKKNDLLSKDGEVIVLES